MNATRPALPESLLAWTPLTPTVFFILLALADGPKHGYVIRKLAIALSDERVRMGPGALYTTIQRLVDAELIGETERREGEDARRRLYKLTRLGRDLLTHEVRSMESVLKTAHGLKLGSAAR